MSETTTQTETAVNTERRKPSWCGAGWFKQGVDAEGLKWQFVACEIEIDNKKHFFTMRKNDYKTKDSDPSYKFFINKKRTEQEKAKLLSVSGEQLETQPDDTGLF